MDTIVITENKQRFNNIDYLKSNLSQLITSTKSNINSVSSCGRIILTIDFSEYYHDIIVTEIFECLAEIIAINYKYNFFKNNIKVAGLKSEEREILYTVLIAADLEEDKRYVFNKLKNQKETAIDGVYNFRLLALKKKWKDIVNCIPQTFLSSQLREFVTYLTENKTQKVFIDSGKVFDSHYRRLKRVDLLDGENIKLIREVLLSNCGEIRLSGTISKDDEYYLKQYYLEKIYFQDEYFS